MGRGRFGISRDAFRPVTLAEAGRRGSGLVSGRLGWRVKFTAGVAVAGLTGFGFAARNSSRPLLVDRNVDSLLVRTLRLWHGAALLLSRLGDPPIFGAATSLIVLLLLVVGDYRGAVAAPVSVAITLGLVERVFKPFFNRDLGSLPSPVFPSGHAAVSAALAGAVILASGGSRPLGCVLGPLARRLLMAIAAATSGAIGVAMVALRFHYVSDVAAGWPLGLAVTGCTAWLVDLLAEDWPPVPGSASDPEDTR